MLRYIASGLAVLALGTGVNAETNKIKIGYVNTFSGPNAFIGNDERDGFELALDHLNHKMGGLDVQMIYEDDQIKPEIGRRVVSRIATDDDQCLNLAAIDFIDEFAQRLSLID